MSSRASLQRSGVTTARPSSVAVRLTGLGTRSPPRPRFRSGWVTTSGISWPASCRARRAPCASGGLPRKTSRIRILLLRLGRVVALRLPEPAHLPAGATGAQDPHGLLAEVGLEAVEEEEPVEVVGLVEEDAAEQVLPFPGELLAVAVEALEGHAPGPDDREVQPGHRQAALLVLPRLRGLGDGGIDDRE